jgi:PAS domain S-box-containing protein
MLALLGLMVALVGLVSWHALRSSYEAYVERADDTVENIARGLARTIAAEIGRIDTVMQAAALAIERAGGRHTDPREIDAILKQQRRLLPQVNGLRVAMASGAVVGDTGANGRPIDVSDRDYFVRVRDAADGLVVSEPIQSRLSGRWVLVLARALRAPDGSFAGAVLAIVDTSYFEQLFGGVEIGTSGAITLRTGSMRLVWRQISTATSPPPIGSAEVSTQLREALAAPATHGAFRAYTAVDGVERINRFHRIEPYGLVVLAGMAVSEYLAPWRREAWLVGSFATVLLLVLLSSSALMWRAWMQTSASARQAERAARRYQALMHTASDGIHVLDRAGRIVDLSDAFAAMLGYEREEMLGMPVTAWDAQSTASELEASLRAFRVGEHEDFVTRHRRADGTLIDVEVSSVGVEIDGRELLYCSARDITQRRRTEQALRDLAREQALRAQAERHAQQLDALLRERGDMLDVLAHEVRQPLNNASAALQSAAVSLAEARDAGAPLRITRAQNVLGQVMSSIDNTLAVASLLGRTGPVERVDTDIDMLLAMSIGDMPAGERRRVRIERRSRVRTASMDMSLMRLALRNLLSNALKYAPPGSDVTIRISDADDPLELNIDVIDGGPGIPPEQESRMFERGTRGSHGRTIGGLGLGLYIVRRVMELHGGSVHPVPSTEGFTMRLVLAEVSSEPVTV